MRTYAIGDIHGHLEKLIAAHGRIAADRARTGDDGAPVVHLGDLVDRGPNSAGVIGHLIAGIAAGSPWVVLKGNHDRMMTLFLQDNPARDPRLRAQFAWLDPTLGGIETLASYGVALGFHRPNEVHAAARASVPQAHVTFLAGLPTSYRRGRCLFVHAGIRPGIPLEAQSEDDLLWIRGEFHHDRRNHGALVIHGHTPVDAPEHHGNRVNLDSGAAFGGPLTAAVIEDEAVYLLTDNGREPLLPF
jgi:serine/threonine protein phosphatase 1